MRFVSRRRLATVTDGPGPAQTHTPPRRWRGRPRSRRCAGSRWRERSRSVSAIGSTREARCDFNVGFAEFERIVALNPGEPQARPRATTSALAYANSGRNADAATRLHAAIALDPGFLAAIANLVSVDLALGESAKHGDGRSVRCDGTGRRARVVLARHRRVQTVTRDRSRGFREVVHVNPSYASHITICARRRAVGTLRCRAARVGSRCDARARLRPRAFCARRRAAAAGTRAMRARRCNVP